MKQLITADQLKNSLSDYAIIDTRSSEEYMLSHLEGAVHMPVNPALKEGNSPISEANFAGLMGRLGITNDSRILVYDDGNGRFTARFWHIAKHYGHKEVFILDGGWPAANSLPKTVQVPDVSSAIYQTTVTPGYIAATDDILRDFDKIKLLDVRTLEEYDGRNLNGNPRGGHIPGAANVSHTMLLSGSSEGYFIPKENIVKLLDSAGINKDDFIMVYCQLGVRASVAGLALRYAGYENTVVYDASMKEWAEKPELEMEV